MTYREYLQAQSTWLTRLACVLLGHHEAWSRLDGRRSGFCGRCGAWT